MTMEWILAKMQELLHEPPTQTTQLALLGLNQMLAKEIARWKKATELDLPYLSK